MIYNKDNKEDNKPNNDNKLITNKKKTFANIDVGQKIKKGEPQISSYDATK